MTSPSQMDASVTSPETVTTAGSGFVFVNTYGSGVSAAFQADIVAAEQYLESHFTDAVTVHSTFDAQPIDPNASAENFFDPVTVTYASLVGALQSHATSADDFAAVAALQGLSDPSNGAGFAVPIGEARALGLAPAGSGNDDAVVLNSTYWTDADFQNDPGDAIGVLEHELTEGIMGRIGGLWAPMDLFRFTASGQRDFTGGQDGQATYFSTDGKSVYTGLQYHNPISAWGEDDGQDWADWDPVGDDANATDPFGPGGPGVGDPGTLSPTDLRIMDVLGWTLAGAQPPPLPDLVANTVTLANTSLVAGDSTTISYHVENDGSAAAGASVSKIYLSTDNIITTSDTVLASVNDGSLQNGSSMPDSTSITLPGTLAAGTYWIGVIADADGQAVESNENNNASSAVQITVSASPAVQRDQGAPHDFNADGISDILWRNDNGQVATWDARANGTFNAQLVSSASNDWRVQDTGDFNGDGLADILWRNSNGQVAIWDAQSNGTFDGRLVGSAFNAWHIQGTGDFNGDGLADILWQNDNGQVAIWDAQSNGTFNGQLVGSVSSGWHMQGTGDFNGDGLSDILWRNDATGQVAIWDARANGTFNAQAIGTNTSAWHIQAIGDFNGDGLSDILWRNDSGLVQTWDMHANGTFTSQQIGGVSTAWHVQDTGDFNGDAFADILWRNDNGQAAVWDARSDGSFNGYVIGEAAADWHVADTNHAGLTIV